MDFFDGLSFSMFGSVPESTEFVRNEPRYYGIQFNYRGSFRLRIDHGPLYEENGPYVFLTYPGHFFEYGAVRGETRHHNFLCAFGSRIHSYIEGGLFVRNVENPLIPIPYPEKFLHTMLEIMALDPEPGRVIPRAVWLFEDLLLQIRESVETKHGHTPYQAESLKKLMKKIISAPEQDWDFTRESEKLYVTPTHFRRIFKEISGLPPQQFLIQTRLSRAAELLKSTDSPVKEVAALSGWDNVFYFSRLFRKKYFISPLQYRKESHS